MSALNNGSMKGVNSTGQLGNASPLTNVGSLGTSPTLPTGATAPIGSISASSSQNVPWSQILQPWGGSIGQSFNNLKNAQNTGSST
jgi:hypothetical protein